MATRKLWHSPSPPEPMPTSHSAARCPTALWLAAGLVTAGLAAAAGPAEAATVRERRVEVILLPDGTVRESTSLRVRMDDVGDLDDWSRYPIVIDQNRELVKARGRVVRPDGGRDKIRRRHRDEISLSGGHVFHGSARAVFLEPPGLRVGSVVEIETETETDPYFPGGSVTLLADDPVESTTVTVRGAPAGLRWQIDGPDAGWTVQQDETGLVLTARDLVPLDPVEAGPGGTALYPVLRYAWGPDATWAGVGRWYRRLVTEMAWQPEPVRQRAVELLGRAPAPSASAAERRAVLDVLTRSVQAEVRYVAVEVGIGGYRPSPPDEVLDRAWGDCKDKGLLLIDLLATAGITAHPVLVLSADDRRIEPDFPSPFQFNHFIVAVPTGEVETAAGDAVAGGYLFVDATQSRGGTGWLQPAVQGQHGLVVLPDGGELVRLPVLPEEERITLVANLRIDPAGEAAGGAALAVAGVSALRLLYQTEAGSPSRTEDTVRQLLLAFLPGAELGQVAYNPKEGDLPALEVAAGLRIPHFLQGAGGRAWMALPSLRAAPEPRRFDDRGGRPLVTDAVTISVTWHLTLPPGCTSTGDRDDEVVNAAGAFRQAIRSEDGGRVTLSRQVVLGERWYQGDALDGLAEIAVAEHRALRRRLPVVCPETG